MKIQESAENYLEAILVIQRRKGMVRSIDVVNELEFSKPSVSVAMKRLREEGCIEMDHAGYITLTEKGNEIATRVYERHELFTEWLTSLGVPPDIAAQDACRIEHVLSVESFSAIKRHVEERQKPT
jgi:Mn-dependent DtxR family transcriptional regulator